MKMGVAGIGSHDGLRVKIIVLNVFFSVENMWVKCISILWLHIFYNNPNLTQNFPRSKMGVASIGSRDGLRLKIMVLNVFLVKRMYI